MSTLPGTSRLILVADEKFPRYSEGDVIELTDGRLLLALARKDGASDFAKGTLIGKFSRDRGVSWDDDVHVIQGPFDDVGDLMSVSLFRTKRGVHLLFLGRGPDGHSDTRVYQMISTDEAKTWSKPIKVSVRGGYHIVNNARVIATTTGRLIVPAAWVTENINKNFNHMRIVCLLSDDAGETWAESKEIVLENEPLMEPGVAQCADGSIYMTIRTKMGVLYEARSRDDGATWTEFGPSKLDSPAAPSTVFRDPNSPSLWMFWINRPKGTWKQRTPLAFARSDDQGKTWTKPRNIEDAKDHGYGYFSVTVIAQQAMLTYYDWPDRKQPSFHMTSLRQRTIPLDWFAEKPTPPVFRAQREPVLAERGRIISANSGLLAEKDRWRLWYTAGELSRKGEKLAIRYAESADAGRTWKTSDAKVIDGYHASAHRDGDEIILYLWQRDEKVNGLFRYVSADDSATFAADPAEPLIEKSLSNDAFSMITSGMGTLEYFAAVLEKARDERAIIKHDNAAGQVRVIGRAASSDGVHFSTPEIILQPDYAGGDPFDTQFYGIQVLRHRGFYLGLLHVFHADTQVIQPEWVWSHDGLTWARTRIKCIPLGDEGMFDSRMILFGDVVMTDDEVIWLYAGCDWRHNEFRKGEVSSAIGRATMARAELEAWLDSLPQP